MKHKYLSLCIALSSLLLMTIEAQAADCENAAQKYTSACINVPARALALNGDLAQAEKLWLQDFNRQPNANNWQIWLDSAEQLIRVKRTQSDLDGLIQRADKYIPIMGKKIQQIPKGNSKIESKKQVLDKFSHMLSHLDNDAIDLTSLNEGIIPSPFQFSLLPEEESKTLSENHPIYKVIEGWSEVNRTLRDESNAWNYITANQLSRDPRYGTNKPKEFIYSENTKNTKDYQQQILTALYLVKQGKTQQAQEWMEVAQNNWIIVFNDLIKSGQTSWQSRNKLLDSLNQMNDFYVISGRSFDGFRALLKIVDRSNLLDAGYNDTPIQIDTNAPENISISNMYERGEFYLKWAKHEFKFKNYDAESVLLDKAEKMTAGYPKGFIDSTKNQLFDARIQMYYAQNRSDLISQAFVNYPITNAAPAPYDDQEFDAKLDYYFHWASRSGYQKPALQKIAKQLNYVSADNLLEYEHSHVGIIRKLLSADGQASDVNAAFKFINQARAQARP